MLKKIKKIWKFATDPYCTFYAFYYFFYAFWIIIFPKKIIPPPDAISCRIKVTSPTEGEKNFLYAKITHEDKWKFTERIFALTVDGKNYIKLPSFTQWDADEETQEDEIRFGINHKIVKKYPKIKKIVTWHRRIKK